MPRSPITSYGAAGAPRPPTSFDRSQCARHDGKKRDFTSLPYSKIQAFSIETAGTFDLDAELDFWFTGLGKVRLEFKGNSDIRQLGHMIATYVL
jgi:Bacterial PH domain